MELDFLDCRPPERELAVGGVARLFFDGAVHLASLGGGGIHGRFDAANDVTDELAERAHEGFVVPVGHYGRVGWPRANGVIRRACTISA